MIKRLLLLSFASSLSFFLSAQNALVVIAHGAPGKTWNAPVLGIEKEVSDELQKRGVTDFSHVRVALMEFTEPSVATVISDLEKQGVRHVFALPLFITSSSHSEQDVPNILGVRFNPNTIKGLKEEGTKLISGDIMITVGPTLSYGDVIPRIISDRVRELSTDSANESFVLVAHGDRDYYPFWNDLLKRTGEAVETATSIHFGGYRQVGMGQRFFSEAEECLAEAAKGKKRVIVQGIYLSSGLKMITEFAKRSEEERTAADRLPADTEYVYGGKGLLPDYRVSQWIVDRAEEWLFSKNELTNE